MPKRKRADEQRSHFAARGAKHRRTTEATVEEQVNAGLRDLTRALKQAKGFERQRLGKRLKDASKSDDSASVDRINAEIATLKALESRADIAQNHLYKVLLRTKSIRDSAKLPPFVREPAKRDDDATLANVLSRLFRSKAANKAVTDTVENVKQTLGLAGPAASSKNNAGMRQDAEDVSIEPEETEYDGILGKEEDGDHDVGHNNIAFESDDDFTGFDECIASSTDEEDSNDNEQEGGRVLSLPTARASSRVVYQPSSQSPSPEPSLTPSISISQSPSPEPRTIKTTASSSLRKTAFLPSLSLGGYISDPDSEAEDLDALGPPRKNKRGQRARQKIWEKKYGTKAKHLQKDGKDRNAGWDARHGAQAAGERRRPGQPWKKEKQPSIVSGANEILVKPRKVSKKNVDDLPLHPSWEAKKLAKERQQIQNVAFVGKKITFD